MRLRSAIASIIFTAPLAMAAGCSTHSGEKVGTADPGNSIPNIEQHPVVANCLRAEREGWARCNSYVRADASGQKVFFATPEATSGFGPPDLQSAYKLPTSGGSGMTVAIVDAYDDPNAESDLATYRSHYGLPSCTTSNGCFKKVDQNGGSSYPKADSGWAGEISLDLDMVSAVCPSCKILLVEANSASMDDLGASVNTAAKLGANAISNSYGGGEDSSVTTADSTYFDHPGILITASSGDNGYGASYPATSAHVVAVGGTSLVKSSNTRGWSETAWSSAGSGCSAYIGKPSYQTDSGCSKRAESDISAVADPNTGVAVYQTYGGSGWAVYGGTSASAPIVAGIFALTGTAGDGPSFPYQHTSWLYDVTSGKNGSCSPSYLCTAGTGYDGPTGLGTPNASLWTSSGGGSSSGGSSGSSGSSSGGSSGGSSSGSSSGGSSGSSGSSSGGSSGSSSGGSGGGTCSHDLCATGTKLTSSCDSCATSICQQDSYCCTVKWDQQCVSEVGTICGESCGGGGGSSSSSGSGSSSGGTGGCSHDICSTGSQLKSTCDACATSICAQDPYCCKTAWDSICVGEVGSICGETCQ